MIRIRYAASPALVPSIKLRYPATLLNFVPVDVRFVRLDPEVSKKLFLLRQVNDYRPGIYSVGTYTCLPDSSPKLVRKVVDTIPSQEEALADILETLGSYSVAQGEYRKVLRGER